MGADIEFGHGEGLLSPVELLLGAIAGCSSINVDTMTARSAEPGSLTVAATGRKPVEDGASPMDGLQLSLNVAVPETADGHKAAVMLERLMDLSHEWYCTVSRTVDHGTPSRARSMWNSGTTNLELHPCLPRADPRETAPDEGQPVHAGKETANR